MIGTTLDPRAISRTGRVLLTIGASSALVFGSAFSASALTLPNIPVPPVVVPATPAVPVPLPTIPALPVALPSIPAIKPVVPTVALPPVIASVPIQGQTVKVDPGAAASATVAYPASVSGGARVSLSAAPDPSLANGLLNTLGTVALNVNVPGGILTGGPIAGLGLTTGILKNPASIVVQGACGSVSIVRGAADALGKVVAGLNLFGLFAVNPTSLAGSGSSSSANCPVKPVTPVGPPVKPVTPVTPTGPDDPGTVTPGQDTHYSTTSGGYSTASSGRFLTGHHRSAAASNASAITAQSASFIGRRAASSLGGTQSGADSLGGGLAIALLLLLAASAGLFVRHLRAVRRAAAL